MASMSQAYRLQLARDYETGQWRQQMVAASEIAPEATHVERVRLTQLPLLLPDLLAAVEGVIVDAPEASPARRMAGGLLTYVCNPLDLIGDDLPLGRVDDVVICALGLQRLHERDGVQLDALVKALCEVAAGCLAHLGPELREGIEEFVADLDRSTHAGAPRG